MLGTKNDSGDRKCCEYAALRLPTTAYGSLEWLLLPTGAYVCLAWLLCNESLITPG
jgi:hypothetical protein